MGKTLRRLAAVATGGALALVVANAALADHTPETAVETTPNSEVTHEYQVVSPSAGADDCEGLQIKLDDMGNAPGTWDVVVGDVTFTAVGDADKHYTIEVTGTIDGEPAVIHAAHLSVGSNASSYYFNPAVTSASNLTVLNPAGKLADVSHIWFCYGADEPGDDPDPTPSVTPSHDPSYDPSESPGVPGGEQPENNLPVTGMQVGLLVILGAGLLAAGVAMMAVRRRRSLTDLVES